MSLLSTLGGAALSVVTGGATGILGVAVQRVFDFLKVKQELQLKKQDQDHEIALRRVDAEIMQQEWAARAKVADIEAAGRAAVAEESSFAASFKAEPTRYSEGIQVGAAGGFMLVLLDFLRGIIRPGLTIYLCTITTLVYFKAARLLPAETPVSDAVAMVGSIVDTILYLTTTCVLWWFGTRNRQKPPGVK